MAPADDVEAYIEAAPKEAQPTLRGIRAAIREAAPNAIEGISYGMPFYSFQGESGVRARLCYCGMLKMEAVFYTRPVFLCEYMDEVNTYLSGKSALHFSLKKPVPIQLIKKLVRNAVRRHATEADG